MSDARLATELEAAGLVRQAQAEGGFGTVLARGDAQRGALVLVVRERGRLFALLERALDRNFRYHWSTIESGPALSEERLAQISTARTASDPDLWLIELDVAAAERFIAETIAAT